MRHIQFISLGGDFVLVLLVSQDQQVQTRFLRSGVTYTQEQLDRFSRYLNDLCQNLTLAEARRRILEQMAQDKDMFDKMVAQALNLSRQALAAEDQGELMIEGTSHILDYPEFAADVAKIRAIFRAFEEKHHLIALLDQTLASQGCRSSSARMTNFPKCSSAWWPRPTRWMTRRWGVWGSSAPCAWIMPASSRWCAIPRPWSPTG